MTTAALIGQLIRTFGLLWIVIGWSLMAAFGFLVPLSIFRIARHTRRIGIQLERFNDLLAGGSLALRYTPEPPPVIRDHGARAAVGAGPLKL